MNNLYRSRSNRMIAGVAGGMAEHANMDVALMRLVWVLALFLGGTGFIAYIICWIVIPEAPLGEEYKREEIVVGPEELQENKAVRRRTIGVLLIAAGLLFLAKNFIPVQHWDKIWPLLLVALGLYIIFANRNGE